MRKMPILLPGIYLICITEWGLWKKSCMRLSSTCAMRGQEHAVLQEAIEIAKREDAHTLVSDANPLYL